MLYAQKLLSAFIALAPTISAIPSIAAEETQNARQTEYVITVPVGTVFPIAITAYLNTKSSQVGDTVYATTLYPIWIQQRLVIPKGSEIRGTLTEVVRPGRIKGKGRMAIRFDDILLPNGVQRDLSVTLHGMHGAGSERINRDTESVDTGSSEEDIETIAISAGKGAATGAIIGIATGGAGRGAAIGAGVGAAADAITVLFSRGKDLVLAPGTQFDLELLRSMEFSYYEIEFNRYELNDARRSAQVPVMPATP